MFSLRNFVVSSLKLRSLIHFDFIFVHVLIEYSDYILLHVCLIFPPVIEEMVFPCCILLCPLLIVSAWVSIQTLSCSIGLCVPLGPVLYALTSFVVLSLVREWDIFSFKVVVAIQALIFPQKSQNCLFQSLKTAIDI